MRRVRPRRMTRRTRPCLLLWLQLEAVLCTLPTTSRLSSHTHLSSKWENLPSLIVNLPLYRRFAATIAYVKFPCGGRFKV
ncbi:uncharacterized protein BDV14DRAFT_117787 [Aspergillus stella-maris]|uniref:uncharacterized protein n=1 Tax=Aspergillus stella-maris TaxID=1810926 RepID=UPI003CCCBA10